MSPSMLLFSKKWAHRRAAKRRAQPPRGGPWRKTPYWTQSPVAARLVSRAEVGQVVDATEGCRVLDVTRALSITVGGASKVVDKVEAAGFCRRQPNPTDGRSNLIHLTESGVDLLKAANITLESALAE